MDSKDKKALYILLIAIVIFIILLVGSIIGLKITRNGIDKFLSKNNLQTGNLNYIIYEDGKKENTSNDVVNAEFEFDGLKFSHFVIETIDGVSTVKLNVQNTTDNEIAEKTIKISFLDEFGNEVIEDKVATTNGNLESKINKIIIIPINDDISNITSIDLVVLNEEDNIDSGEEIINNDSGENM